MSFQSSVTKIHLQKMVNKILYWLQDGVGGLNGQFMSGTPAVPPVKKQMALLANPHENSFILLNSCFENSPADTTLLRENFCGIVTNLYVSMGLAF